MLLMNRCTNIALLLLFAAVGGANAQSQSSKPDADRPPVVEVAGCLSQAGAVWTLTNASDPAVAKTSFTTPEAVKEAAEKPLGTQQYRLLGASPFGPEGHKGHKIVVRGLLVKSGDDTRINLTSLQMLAETCAK
jgi:hypothetical protein